MSTITYIDKIGAMLDKLKVGEVFDIDKNVKKETRGAFIEIVKSYIDRNMGRLEGWCIEFNGEFENPRRPGWPRNQ